MPFDINYLWNLKKTNSEKQSGDYQELGGKGNGKYCQGVQASSCKSNKFWGSNVPHGDCGQ